MSNVNAKMLNEKYSGKFRDLTKAEKDFYEDQLNKNDNEWFEPYAIREKTHDLVCKYDGAGSFDNELFIRIQSK